MNPDWEHIALRQLEPVFLLVRLYAFWDGALLRHCGPIRDRYRRRGDDILNALCANCDREIVTRPYGAGAFFSSGIKGHPEDERLRERLLRHGVASEHVDYDEPGGPHRLLRVDATARHIETVRQLAKQDLGASSGGASEAFDRRFILYINQHIAYDWKEWRERSPLVSWPSPAEGSHGLRDELHRFA